MAKLTFLVPASCDGVRLDTFLRREHGVSGTALKLAKRQEMGLTMDGEKIRSVDPVRAGALIGFDTGEESREYRICDIRVPVLYEDALMAVFLKPAGMPSHPSKGHPCDTLANVFASREETRGLAFRPVNRLDKDTSGIVVAAKSPYAAYALPGRIKKEYLAVACGYLEQDEGRIDLPIDREGEDSRRRTVREDGQRAVTCFHVLARGGGMTLLQLRLETGRTHQIRVHLSHLGHPLAGDSLYAGDMRSIERQALHCWKAEIGHPLSGERLLIRAPLPQDIRTLVRLCGWKDEGD